MDLAALARGAVDRSATRQPAAILDGEPGELPVKADSERLGAVIDHVIRNAQDASLPDGSVRLKLLARDAENVLLSRGPRFRLDAEAIRDNALAVSGLLSSKQFGPPVMPYQPSGLWDKVGGAKYTYAVSPGEDAYRRGIYVILKRANPYPSFVAFDASARMACTVRWWMPD